MDGKTLLLVLIGGGVAAYLAYSLAKGGGTASPGGAGSGVAVVDTAPSPYSWGLGSLSDDALCRVAPSLCSWSNPPFVPRHTPGQLLW